MFKVGDKVRVVHRVESGSKRGMENTNLPETRWNNSWVAEMDTYIKDAEIYTISSITPSGVYFAEKGRFGWPAAALKRAAKRKVI